MESIIILAMSVYYFGLNWYAGYLDIKIMKKCSEEDDKIRKTLREEINKCKILLKEYNEVKQT